MEDLETIELEGIEYKIIDTFGIGGLILARGKERVAYDPISNQIITRWKRKERI